MFTCSGKLDHVTKCCKKKKKKKKKIKNTKKKNEKKKKKKKKKKKRPILGHTIKQLIGGGFVGGEVQNKIIFAQVKIK